MADQHVYSSVPAGPDEVTVQERGIRKPEEWKQWSTPLCSCCRDLACCYHVCLHAEVVFCPCITFGRNVEMLTKGKMEWTNAAAIYYLMEQFTCLGGLYSCQYRRQIRMMYKIKEGPCPDCIVHTFCPHCAFSQEFKELEAHGMNPYLGWPRGATLEERKKLMKKKTRDMEVPVPPVMEASSSHE